MIRSPPGKHQGVAVALNTTRFEYLKPLHQDLHTVHTVAVMARTHSTAGGLRQELIVVGHYSQPAEKEQCQQELEFFVRNLRIDHPDTPIVLAGDLNA